MMYVGKEYYAKYDNIVRIEALKEVKGKGKLVDVGCGIGRYGLKLKKMGFSVYGIDVNKEALKVCKKKGLNVKYSDVQAKIDFPNNYFDVAWCTEVIEHLKKPKKALDEIHRILKKGGKLILTTPNTNIFYPKFNQNPSHVQFFNMKSLLKLFGKKWEIEKVVGIFPPRLYSLFHLRIHNKFLINILTPNFIVIAKKA